MSDLAPTISKIPFPGRALWWLGGAVTAGIDIPVAIGAMTALLAYYPVGSFLPRISLFSVLGSVLVIGATALVVVALGIGYSILALNWRPLLLAIVTAGMMVPSVYPGMAVHLYLHKLAFGSLAERSATLVEAIKRYKRDTGAPPEVLADLVPRYLAEVPHTGMSAYPEYWYGAAPGYCSDGNAWSVTVYAGGFDVFVYCPNKDDSSRAVAVGDWAYYRD